LTFALPSASAPVATSAIASGASEDRARSEENRELDERARGCERRRPASPSPNLRTDAGKKYSTGKSDPRGDIFRFFAKDVAGGERLEPSIEGLAKPGERPGARYFRARDQRSKRRGGFDSSARVGIRAIGENRNRSRSSLDGIRSGV
jgi:hypothetical protein